MPEATVAPQSKTSLPTIVLGSSPVPLNVLRFIPLEAAEKYQVCAFESTPDTIKLAIVHPEQLKQGFDAAVRDIAQKMGKKVVLYQTDPRSFHKLIRQYKDEGKAASQPPAASEQNVPRPPLFELGKTVVYNFLRRVPLSYADHHRLLCVDYLAPNTYWFVSDAPDEARVRALLPVIEKENDIVAHLIIIGKEDFRQLREYYAQLEDAQVSAAKPTAEVPKPLVADEPEPVKPEPVMPDPVLEVSPPAPAEAEIVSADNQASILTSKEEKSGIVGLFQRVTSSLSSEPSAAPGGDMSGSAPETHALKPLPPKIAELEKTKDGLPAKPSEVPATPAAKPAAEVKADPDGDDIGKLLTKQIETQEELREIAKKGFIPRIVAAVVSFGIHEKASDIHIEAYEDEVRVRFRIDGQLIDIVKISPEVHAAMVSRIKILSKLRLDESRVPQDGRFDVKLGNTQVDLRVSIMPTVHGEKVVMRILDKSKGIVTMEGLGMAGLGYQRLLHAITRPYGICLMTGPTGSGKSTSLYAILQRVSMPNVNIVTLEDPVEYELKGINQSQIKPKIGFTFAEGLRSVLRQDPNIIMVGEIRDGETATMATQAALTGHLVLSTLHTNDAAGAIPRLTNMGIEPFLIASSLDIVVGQRLVRKLCQDCKAEVDLPSSVAESITADLEKISELNPVDAKRVLRPFKFYQGTGCPKCHGNGYLGRLGIYEVMEISEAIEDLTLKHASATDIQAQAQKEGMLTMYQDGLLKAAAGLTSLDEVLRESSNK